MIRIFTTIIFFVFVCFFEISAQVTNTFPTIGSVGIGTNSPTEKLEISSGGDVGIRLFNTTANTWDIKNTENGRLDFIRGGVNTYMRIDQFGNVGIGTSSPQKKLEVIVPSNDFASIGVATLGLGAYAGIHFGFRENNNEYRKSAIVFERTDLTSGNAQGKVHILNGPQIGATNATLADAKLTIGESGNVGIGTTNPIYRLDINGDGNFSNSVITKYLKTAGYGSTIGGLIQIWNPTNSNWSEIRNEATGTNSGLSFRYGGGESIRIDGLNGNVGIGTTSPQSKLEVYNSDQNTIYNASTVATWRTIQVKNNIQTNIGTASGISFQGQNSNGDTAPAGIVGISKNSSGGRVDLGFITSTGNQSFERMRIDEKGNVGIGTINPQSPLHIATSISAALRFQRADANIYGFEIGGSTFGLYNYTTDKYSWRTNGENLILNETAGNIGIGTASPNAPLQFSNVIENKKIVLYEGANNDNQFYGFGINPSTLRYQTYTTLDDHVFFAGVSSTSSNELMRIKGNGSVGIGTTTIPSGFKLAVAGNVIAEKVKVKKSNTWPDFVFSPTYKLPNLTEVENFVKQNSHLPEIPSAAEIEKDGQDLGEMNRLLLKKVEELTLYLIEEKKRNDNLQKRVENLENTQNRNK